MKSKKEVKEYLEDIKEDQAIGIFEGIAPADSEESLIMEIQIETLEWVLR
jgi:hypothetical protein